jgi:hypothetical protein
MDAHTNSSLAMSASLSPNLVMEKSPMPTTPPAGYLPERPCSTTPDVDSPPGSPPKDSTYSRQNPFGISQQQQSPEDDELNTRGGGRNGGLCEVLLAACCCFALCEICC